MGSNVTHLGNGYYLVQTQAGFRRLLKRIGWKKGDCLVGDEYPRKYPSVVTVSRTGPGDGWINVRAIVVQSLVNQLREARLITDAE